MKGFIQKYSRRLRRWRGSFDQMTFAVAILFRLVFIHTIQFCKIIVKKSIMDKHHRKP